MLFLLNFFLVLTGEEILASTEVWPSGTYGLPKTWSKCPRMWQEGWRKQAMENVGVQESQFSYNIHMNATLSGNYIRRAFCIKTKDPINGEIRLWPIGSYCIYKKYYCPAGMKEGYIKWDDEDHAIENNEIDGALPDGEYNDDTKIYYCCQNQGSRYNSIELPVDQPFYLLPFGKANCQRVKWSLSTLEYITYDTEDGGNIDHFEEQHVFTNKQQSLPKIYYCYYEGCNYKAENDKGFLNSPTNYPDFQYCSWMVAVNDSFVISLIFISLNVSYCDENYIEIYDGFNDTAPLLARYCGLNATSGSKVETTGNNLYVVLKSGDNSRSPQLALGFKAKYTARKRRSSSVALYWPSGTYGLPKPVSGCPENWTEGWRKQDLEDDRLQKSSFSSSFHMDAILNNDYINRSFCIKTRNENRRHITWPAGSYCIYKKIQCSSGMKVGLIKWDDEDNGHRVNKNERDGILPDGEYDSNTKVYYCCEDRGEWSNSIELPVNRPFYLLPHNSANCQRVKWALSSLEYIVYDTEDYYNGDKFIETHVFSNEENSLPKIYYCYYKDCRFVIRGDNGEFSSNISNGSYPDFQFCSWLVELRKDLIVSLKLNYFLLSNCLGNYIDIYDGENDTFPLLRRYCGRNTTSVNQVLSNGSTILIVFKSGNNSLHPSILQGFHAVYEGVGQSPTTALPLQTTAIRTRNTMRKPTITTPQTTTLMSTSTSTKATATTLISTATETVVGSSDGGSALLISLVVIVPTLAVIIIVLIIRIFYSRRNKPVTQRQPAITNPEFDARNGIYMSARNNHPNNGFIETNETDNPVYDSGEEHLYCTIPEAMAEHQAVYTNQTMPTSHNEEPHYLQPLEQPNRVLPPEERMYDNANQAQ